MELTGAEELDEEIVVIWRSGGELLLSEIIDVAFDELLVFPEGAEAERINGAAGGKLLTGTYYTSSSQLFLFREAGEAVLAAMVSSDVFEHEVQNATFGPDVGIVGEGGEELITLVE